MKWFCVGVGVFKFYFLPKAKYFPPSLNMFFTHPHDPESIRPQEQIYLLHIPVKKKKNQKNINLPGLNTGIIRGL